MASRNRFGINRLAKEFGREHRLSKIYGESYYIRKYPLQICFEKIGHAFYEEGIVLTKQSMGLSGVGEIFHLFTQVQKLLIQGFRPGRLDGVIRFAMVQAESRLAAVFEWRA